MSDVPPSFDPAVAHRHFSTTCFNDTWELIEKPDRTADEDQLMLATALTSLWHWRQRQDCTSHNFSVGHWQVARVAALLGEASLAKQHADLAMEHSKDLPPYFRGYAHECAARAAALLGDRDTMKSHLKSARKLALEVTDLTERAALEEDLNSITIAPGS